MGWLVLLGIIFIFWLALGIVKQNQKGTVRCAYCGKVLKRTGLGQRAVVCHHCGRSNEEFR